MSPVTYSISPAWQERPGLAKVRFSPDQKLQRRLVVTREPCHNCVFKIYYAERRLLTACVSICVLWAHRIRLIISTWFSSVGQSGPIPNIHIYFRLIKTPRKRLSTDYISTSRLFDLLPWIRQNLSRLADDVELCFVYDQKSTSRKNEKNTIEILDVKLDQTT